MKFGSVTDNDIGKNQLNFGHDPDHGTEPRSGRNAFQFQERDLLFMRPLNNTSVQRSYVFELRYSI